MMVTYALTSGDVALDQMATLARFQGLVTGDLHSNSDLRRSTILPTAMYLISQAPIFGHGLGSWPILVLNVDIQNHPHNMILEVLCELGFVGLALLSLTFIAVLRRINVESLRSDPLFLAATMLFINTFLNSMTSGDFPENRNVFVMLGLMLVRSMQVEDEPEQAEDEVVDHLAAVNAQDDYAAYQQIRSRRID
jgi:O-antigen ligase